MSGVFNIVVLLVIIDGVWFALSSRTKGKFIFLSFKKLMFCLALLDHRCMIVSIGTLDCRS